MSNDFPLNLESIVQGQKLLSHQDEILDKSVKTTYLGLDRNIIAFEEADNDFRYLSDAVPKKSFYPAAFCK